MSEPCRSCDEKHRDFGGCRCQAFMVTGDASLADPVCSKSPNHHKITDFVAGTLEPAVNFDPMMFRNKKNSKKLSLETR